MLRKNNRPIAIGNRMDCLYPKLRRDQYRSQPTGKIDPSTLMTPTLYDLANFNYNRAHSFTHHLMQFMVTTSTTGGVHRYADLQNAGNSTWNTYYLQLTNIKEMYELARRCRSK